jgi:hypothetical protein
MSRARNIRRRNARRKTCSNCRLHGSLQEWNGRVLCIGCYMIDSTDVSGGRVLRFLGRNAPHWTSAPYRKALDYRGREG